MNARELELRIHWAHEKLYQARRLAQLRVKLKKAGINPPECLRTMAVRHGRQVKHALLALTVSLDDPNIKTALGAQSKHTHMLFYEIIVMLAKLGYLNSAKHLKLAEDIWPEYTT